MENPVPLILASRSPRRRELLTTLGLKFDVVLPDPSAEPDGEEPRAGETVVDLVQRLAFQKAEDVARSISYSALVIGCDTVAEVDGIILGKPVHESDARRMLKLLSGRRHSVWSGLCLIHASSLLSWKGYAESQLEMKPLSQNELESYLQSGMWKEKSGAFGYQDGHSWLKVISGSVENVVGLPVDLLKLLLQQASFLD